MQISITKEELSWFVAMCFVAFESRSAADNSKLQEINTKLHHDLEKAGE